MRSAERSLRKVVDDVPTFGRFGKGARNEACAVDTRGRRIRE